MMHNLIEKADKLLEMASPLLEKLTDDTDDQVPERALDACIKIVELSHYLYEIAMMKKKMYPHEVGDTAGRETMADPYDNPRKV